MTKQGARLTLSLLYLIWIAQQAGVVKDRCSAAVLFLCLTWIMDILLYDKEEQDCVRKTTLVIAIQ